MRCFRERRVSESESTVHVVSVNKAKQWAGSYSAHLQSLTAQPKASVVQHSKAVHISPWILGVVGQEETALPCAASLRLCHRLHHLPLPRWMHGDEGSRISVIPELAGWFAFGSLDAVSSLPLLPGRFQSLASQARKGKRKSLPQSCDGHSLFQHSYL